MLPEVDTYIKRIQDISKHFNAHCDDMSWSEYENLRKEAVKDLAKATNDKLVKWIAEHEEIQRDFPDHANRVLERLPATISELNEYANERGWCGVWDNFRNAAIKAGAIDVNMRFEMRWPGGEWQNFRPFRMGGENFTKKELTSLFLRGAHIVTIEMRSGELVQFRQDPESVANYRR